MAWPFLVAVIGGMLSIPTTVAFGAQDGATARIAIQDTLVLGQSVLRQMKPPALHRWTLDLMRDEYAEIEVLRHGLTIAISAISPAGAQRLEFDSSSVTQDTQRARWIADATGPWFIDIASAAGPAEGSYEIRWVAKHTAGHVDHQLLQADSLAVLGERMRDDGRYKEAEPLLRRALAVREENLGANHRDVATILNQLAELYDDQGRAIDAELLAKRALVIRQGIYGPDHPDIATSLDVLGSAESGLERLAASESLYARALSIRERTLQPDHSDLAESLNNLANVYLTEGRFADAEPLMRRALAIWENTLGRDHRYVSVALLIIGRIYADQGRYADAEPLFWRALANDEKSLGPDHPSLTPDLNNLALLYWRQGRFADAERVLHRSLRIGEKALGPQHPYVTAALHDLARIYTAQGHFTEAESVFKRVIASREAVSGPDVAFVAMAQNDLALIYQREGRHAEAEPLLRHALAVRERELGLQHPDVAASVTALARTLFEMGRDAEAELLVARAIASVDSEPGPPEIRSDVLSLRARIRKTHGNFRGALADLGEAIREAEGHRPNVGGDEARADYFARYSEQFNLMIRWQLEAGDIATALEYVERGRARVLLDQLSASRVDIREGIPRSLRDSLESRETIARSLVAEEQKRISRLRERTDISESDRARQTASLSDSLRATERVFHDAYDAITAASPVWRDLVTEGGRPVSLGTVQAQVVPKHGVLLVYRIGPDASELFVIWPTGGKVQVVPLIVGQREARSLDLLPGPLTAIGLSHLMKGHPGTLGLVAAMQSRPARPTSAIFRLSDDVQLLGRLNALWRVLTPANVWQQIRAVREIVVIPDRGLYQLPFEALVVSRGATMASSRFWLDVGPPIRYAPSTTTLANLERRQGDPSRPSLRPTVLTVSNPSFTGASGVSSELVSSADQRAAALAQSEQEIETRFRGAGGRLVPLPGTAAESREIQRAFRGVGPVTILQASDATEGRLRAALAGRRYVHIATHAIVDEERSALFASLALSPPTSPSPFAAMDDGFLQLNEIYELRLRDVELAVLSACRTNAGEMVDGEGVFALARGFHAAGARRVVASDWDVDDAASARVVGRFFTEIAHAERAGRSPLYSTALAKAKAALRNDALHPQWAHPYYWAPLVLSGTQ